LKPGKPRVYLYNGKPKDRQDVHEAVVEIDTGNRDLQQCADAIIRLRAEYLFSIKKFGAIHFNFTSGDTAPWNSWRTGERPKVKGNIVTWKKKAQSDSTYRNFQRYLNIVFSYAGSYSLSREMEPVPEINRVEIGDVFIEGGFPGHAVIVVDMAVHQESGKQIFLLAQSYMPAQNIHILVNPRDRALSPWYHVDFGKKLRTPEWTFTPDHLMRFRS